jgi:hypothetical protein
MRSCGFVFPFAGFVKQIATMSEAAKTLGTIDVLWLSMHVNIANSQEAFMRNCALSMAVDLFPRAFHHTTERMRVRRN